MARLKDKWSQRVRVQGRELLADVKHVTMIDGAMFGKLKSKDMHEIDVTKLPNKDYWTPVYHKE